jgi:hypothetical protein
MSCTLLTARVDGVKPSFMLEVEIYATEPFFLVYFVEAVVIIFLFFNYSVDFNFFYKTLIAI